MDKLRILFPKGRIFENVFQLFSDAGLPVSFSDRTYRPVLGINQWLESWMEVKVMKPQNVGELLEMGSHDAGFTGVDWIRENSSEVEEIMDLSFDKVSIVAAIPKGSDENTLKNRKIVVATEYPNIAEEWLKANSWQYKIVRTYGATEVFPPDDADMIIDNSSSGQTLKENGLKVISTLMESSTRFVASKTAMANSEKRERIEELAMHFKAVLNGRERVMLEMNIPKANFKEIVAGLPAMRSPTVSPLYGDEGYAVKIAVKKTEVPLLITNLKKAGATDIVEYELRKVVP